MITVKKIKNYLKMLKNQNDELIWANVWHDTQRGIPWLVGGVCQVCHLEGGP